jgi:hypothetical protein
LKQILILFQLAFFSILPVFAQNRVVVELQKNSSLIIHGSTNIVPFSLIQKGEKLSRSEVIVNFSKNQNRVVLGQSVLSVEVNDFRSDNKMAQHDFRKLVKADLYPQIHLQVMSLEMQPGSENGRQTFSGYAVVSITITNVTRHYTIPFIVTNEKEIHVVDGKKRISIRDFGLEPPVQMMGLIKVSEWIDVDFHLIFRISQEKQN